MGSPGLCAIFTILWLSLQAHVLESQNLTCNSDDLKALEGFMNGLESAIEGWDFSSTGLSSSNCCNWVGITCNSSINLGLDDPVNSGRVVKLELHRRRLSGVISDSFISANQLRTLNLSSNLITGSLPFSLFQLPNLEILDLRNNRFTSFIPTITHLHSIVVLDLSENNFDGPLPLTICQNSTQIKYWSLGRNLFSGLITPDIGYCKSLQHLSLHRNKLVGVLPKELFTLPKLARLDLQWNEFTGSLSDNVGNLSSLVSLDVSVNRFSGNIPDCFHNLKELEFLDIQSNNFNGLIPKSLFNSPSIRSLSLRQNSLFGPISFNCSSMINLESLDLGSNQFVDYIPDNLPSCTRLSTLNLARNKMYGQIPESYKKFDSLTYLSISNCSIYNISSALDILQHCKNLTTLVLTLNFQNEEMPTNSAIHFKSLRALVIGNCRLTGNFPRWLNGSTQLQLLDLSWNRLDGRIPAWLGNFNSLFYLDLSNNTFTGEIPRTLAGLSSLVTNYRKGEEPSLNFPFFSSNRGFQYNQISSFPPTLELSNNFLSGPIWPEFGNLKGVHTFDLKYNNLFGNIPESLSGMTSVEVMDLSHNNLSGRIPPSLVNLSFMSRFSVAFNNLSGLIPNGGQFLTFPNSSFEGNAGLCGYQNAPCQPRIQIPTEPARESSLSKATKGIFVMGAVGFAVGMTVGIGAEAVLSRLYKRRNQPPLDLYLWSLLRTLIGSDHRESKSD